MKKILLATLLLAGAAHAQQANQKQHKLVMQLTSNDTLVWKMLMNNLKNLKEGWGEEVRIEVVAFGPGIDLLLPTKTTQQGKVSEFSKKGVTFVACERTLKMRNLDKKELLPEAGTVPMGIGELILKQEEGWSYMKAGF